MTKNHLKPDREANLQMQDFRDGLAPRLPNARNNEEGFRSSSSSIPSLQPYIAHGSGAISSMPLVSISVNQTVPLRDILYELAQQAEYDIELDPRIRGSIIFTAREKPFDRVIDRISDMAGLRYKFSDKVLRVEVDTPFNKTYKIDYLSYIRTNSGEVNNSIAVVSGDGTDTGSSFSASSSSEADFWGELEANLGQILGGPTNVLRTSTDPRITATEQNPEVQAVVPEATEDGGTQVQVAPPEAVLRVDALPVDAAEAEEISAAEATFTLNRQAGLVSVFATERAHKEVAEYLNDLKRSATSQVLIEAKILEITLNDRNNTGVDWRAIDLLSGEFAFNFLSSAGANTLNTISAPGGTTSVPNATGSDFVVGYAGNDAQALIRALQRFGTVRALASPRLTVLNNQSSVLNVATNQVFFEVDIDVTVDEGTIQTEIDSEIRNVPEGVIVNVQPSIDLEKQAVSLAVRPTVTQIVNEVEDPAVQFVTAQAGITGVQSLVPELNVQEIDSVIQVKSGQAVVLGGLLQDRVQVDEDGVPVLSEVPMMGALFRNHADDIRKTELVIFLKATILDSPSDSVHNTDRDLYRRFSGDRRPFKL